MEIALLVLVIAAFGLVKAAQKTGGPARKVSMLYQGTDYKIVDDHIIFACGCRFHIGSQDRALCAGHDAIFHAEARI